MKRIRTDNWSNGANNIAKPERLPDGFVRQLVNLDPTAQGELEKRPGYRMLMQCSEARAAYAVRRSIVVVDGARLVAFSVDENASTELGTIARGGVIAGAQLNGQLYLSTPLDSIRTDGVSVKPWAIHAPAFSLELIEGSLPPGLYKVALTALGADGEESGADPLSVVVPQGSSLRISSSDQRSLKVYLSAANGSTLYSQGPLIAGAMALTRCDDYREQLTTTGLVPMPSCEQLASYHGVLLGVSGPFLFVSAAMMPHLMEPVSGFFQYSAPISVLAVTDGGVYVVADKTYFLTELEGTPSQRMVADIDAVAGSAAPLPDGRVAWFTRYGQAIGSPDGSVAFLNRASYAPDVASTGAAGLVEHAGNSMIVTTMRGVTAPNNLATGDFADLEI